MAKLVERRPLKAWERLNILAFLKGMRTTLRWLLKRPITLEYPEARPYIPDNYRGTPTLVKDIYGREKCVACQLCEHICPAKAIRITPGPAPEGFSHIGRAPAIFQIDRSRCIHCGLCEEVCPEEAIVLQKEYSFSGTDRNAMMIDKEELYEAGGTLPDKYFKWGKSE
ncbi:MAG: NADH dehydrogenase [Verrucomicrobia bacterium GWF2_51_19]|nr:MAG: NADH dehydrogenase [Verrucomicrobia bacterium GWF2_51_19]HCJ11679.1 NADH-quinone oxidoreductase subunit D [Opitutae bacterium]